MSAENIAETAPVKKSRKTTATSAKATKPTYTVKNVDMNQYITVKSSFPVTITERNWEGQRCAQNLLKRQALTW